MSSLFIHVTVVPAFTVSVCGPKVKLSIDTVLVGPAARANRTLAARSEPTAAPSTETAIIGRNIVVLLSLLGPVRSLPCGFLALQWRVDDRESLLVLLEGD